MQFSRSVQWFLPLTAQLSQFAVWHFLAVPSGSGMMLFVFARMLNVVWMKSMEMSKDVFSGDFFLRKHLVPLYMYFQVHLCASLQRKIKVHSVEGWELGGRARSELPTNIEGVGDNSPLLMAIVHYLDFNRCLQYPRFHRFTP